MTKWVTQGAKNYRRARRKRAHKKMLLVHEGVRTAVYCSQDLDPRIQVRSGHTTNPSSLGGFGRCLMEGPRPSYDHHVNIIVIFKDEHRCSLAGDVCRWRNTI